MYTFWDKFLCFVFTCWLLIDSANGFAKTYGIDIPVSQILKFGVFLLVLIRLIRIKAVQTVTLFVLIYLLLLTLHFCEAPGGSAEIFILLMKPLTSFYFFFYFVHLAKTTPLYYNKVFFRIIVINFVVLAFNILLGLFGFGNHVYSGGDDGEGIGVKGFLYAQNEISCVVAVLFPFILWVVRRGMSKWKYYLSCVLLIFIAFCVSTKSAILVAILSVPFVTYYLGNAKERRVVLALSVIIAVLTISFISYVITVEMDFLQRFLFFYEKNGLAEALLSGRWQFWLEQKTHFFRQDMLTRLFGLVNFSTCELDPFDALLNLGFIGCCVNISLLIYLLLIPRMRKHKTDYERVLMFSNTLIVFISLFSGHIFFSSMGTMFVALSNSKVMIFKERL